MESNKRQKTIVMINTVLYGSTGDIVRTLKAKAEGAGMSVFTVTAYARNDRSLGDENDFFIGNYFDRYLHLLLSRITGFSGVFSLYSTLRMISILKKIQPDVIHLHNLHNAYINLPILFGFIKDNDIKTIWTLHDCWAFTGRCPHFERVECDKWKSGCHHCAYPKNDYPISYTDRTRSMWTIKNKAFNGVKDMTIVTPSKWLARYVKDSFLGSYPVKVINNGIDLNAFKPTKGNTYSKIKEKNKHVVLGVSMSWSNKKGLDVFIDLREKLCDEYIIILVGTDEALAERLKNYDIECINRTSSKEELAEIYTSADVFVNPTREDNFPTVNIEALACGTPVITFNTGGSPEIVDDNCGNSISVDDIQSLVQAIKDIAEKKKYKQEDCIRRALKYDMHDLFSEYVELYVK